MRVFAPEGRDVSDALLAYGVLLYAFLGVVVLWRRPGHGIGRLALAIALALAVGVLLTVVGRYGPPTEGVRSILAWPVQLAVDLSNVLSDVLLAAGVLLSGSLLLVWFPDGHRTSRLGAVIEAVLVLSVLALILASLKEPDPSRDPLVRGQGDGPRCGRGLRRRRDRLRVPRGLGGPRPALSPVGRHAPDADALGVVRPRV